MSSHIWFENFEQAFSCEGIMLAHCAYEISSGQDCVFRPPEEYVLNVAQIALTAEAQGFGKTTKGGKSSDSKLPKELPPTVVLVTSKNLQGDDVTSTVCTLDGMCRQCSVALSFGWDEDVKFSLHPAGGQGPVSLTGYLQPSPEGMDNEDDMGYGDGDSEESGEEDGGEEEEGSSDDDDDDDDEGMAPLLVGNDKRKRSFDLDTDAIGASGIGSKAAAEKKRTKKGAPEPQETSSEDDDDEDDNESSEDDDDEELDDESADFIRTQLEAMTDPAGRARILSQLDRLQPPLNSKKPSSKAKASAKAAPAEDDGSDDDDEDDEEESGSESDEESDEEEDGEPASPEEAWVKAIKALLKEKGGKASMSHVGNVKPTGLTTKVGTFLKSCPEFKVDGNSVVLA